MTFYRQVEATQTISRQTIGSSLQKNGFRSEILYDFGDDRFEDHLETFIIKSLVEGKVDGMVRTRIFSNIVNMSGSRKIVLEFMERTGHNPIGQVESFLNTVSVVDINIDVQYSLVSFQKFKDSQHAIVDIAKS